MGLKETNSVDIITKPLPGDACKLVLYIIDDGSITDEAERFKLLISKLQAYVTYVMGSQFRTANPGVAAADVLVRVLCKLAPTTAMTQIQSVGPTGDPLNRFNVAFADYDEFMAGLKAK